VLAAKITIEQEGGLFSREMLRDQPVPPPGISSAARPTIFALFVA